MQKVIGVRFKRCGKIYEFEADGIEITKGDLVVAESEFGLSIGNVIIERDIDNPEGELKKIIRKATEEDLLQKEENSKLEAEAKDYCLERIMARGLPMKLVSTEVTLDKKRIIFFFTAEKRIDFRELVKDLAARFKTRIEMRQIGVRDEAKMLGGMGICGKELCCIRFLTVFEPISIKMAKKQELILNTGKLSGLCGRLMCCLGYEYDDMLTEGIHLTEEDSISITEQPEELETIVSSVNSFIQINEPGIQTPPKKSSQEIEKTLRQEQKTDFRNFVSHRKNRRKRSHRK
ncbi:MAG: PSP1 domain-containing protein [Thermodesulfovibrionales bacterium]